MVLRYFVQLSYKGTHYHGWQIQPNAISVQEVLNKAFSTILRQKTELTGAGRTDTGVHASFFVAHFDTNEPIADIEKIFFSLNNLLPFDIALQKIYEVDENMHARFSAKEREYQYFIINEKNPFRLETSYYLHRKLNVDAMNAASQILFEYSDFTSFSKLHTDVQTNICTIYKAFWSSKGSELIFTISADRFLRNMVRAIVGSLVDVGLGKSDEKHFREIIESKNRSNAGFSVPARGLFLTNVIY